MSEIVAAVIVTYNRKALLQRCLAAMVAQTRKPDRIVVVDNASTDGTRETLAEAGWLGRGDIELLALPDNTGGAGGFAAGIDSAVKAGADWVWIMDDDARPHLDALQRLLEISPESHNLYGSAAVSGQSLSWPMTPEGRGPKDVVRAADDLPELLDVGFIPFIGLLVSSRTVKEIGLPDAGFFIAADDVEYSMRARQRGARVILVSSSRVEHPASQGYCLPLPFVTLNTLRLTPWKRYYDVRNRLLVAHKYYGAKLYYQTVPATLIKLVATLIHEGERLMQIKAFVAGMVDGLLRRKGRRHEHWGL